MGLSLSSLFLHFQGHFNLQYTHRNLQYQLLSFKHQPGNWISLQKGKGKICHFIIPSSFLLCNVATVPPLSSLLIISKKERKTAHHHIICCAISQLYHPYHL